MTRPSRQRARALLVSLALGLCACGHYAPPIRPKPAEAAGAATSAPAHPDDDEETRRDAP